MARPALEPLGAVLEAQVGAVPSPARSRYPRAASCRPASTSNEITLPPVSSARAMWSVETPIAVPTSTAVRAPHSATSTSSKSPVSG